MISFCDIIVIILSY